MSLVPSHVRARFQYRPCTEDTHPLISCTVSVDGATGFPSCLYLNTLRAGLYTIVRIHTADNQVRMSIEIAVRGKRSRMFPETGRQHVGQKTRHDCWPKHII